MTGLGARRLRQIRFTLLWLRPVSAAMERGDQACLTPGGGGLRVRTRTWATVSSSDVGGLNSPLVPAGEVPWGGFKGSGYGRDLSIHALDDFSRTKHVTHNHGR